METKEQRSTRILSRLSEVYPNVSVSDLDGKGNHFVAEVEPTSAHPEYDRAVEVIVRSMPHKHNKITQTYTVTEGTLMLHIDDTVITLEKNESYTIAPNQVHWAESDNECWVELYSEPRWTKEDHIPVEI